MLFHNRLLFKIIFLVVLLFTLSMGIFLTVFISEEIQQEADDILSNGLTFAELAAPILYQDYLTASSRGFPRFEDIAAKRLAKNTDIVRTMLIATNGKIIFDSNDFNTGKESGRTGSADSQFITDAQTLQLVKEENVKHRNFAENGKHFVEIVVPVSETAGGHVFSMRYVLSYQLMENQKIEILKGTLFIFIPLFLVTILGGILLAVSITRPVERLLRGVEKIQQGDMDVKIPVQSDDEIGKLTSAFNKMTASLGSTQSQLKEYNKTLEKQVEDRTNELNSKVTEFERVNKLMIGRELKMVELKKEIEKLKKTPVT